MLLGGGMEWRGLHGSSPGSYAVGSQVFFAQAVTFLLENRREVDRRFQEFARNLTCRCRVRITHIT